MIPLPPNGVTPELLAAYADGELDPVARAAVERWLAEHPEALDELLAQRELSPENWPLWQQAEPPAPSEDTWAAVRAGVADAMVPEPAVTVAQTGRAWWAWIGAVAALVLIALGMWSWLDRRKDAPQAPPDFAAGTEGNPLAGIGVLPIATDDDVEIQRVAGNAAAALPVGTPPLTGPIVLASEEDVEVAGADPHPAWGFDGPVLTTAPGDAPMIFAAPPR